MDHEELTLDSILFARETLKVKREEGAYLLLDPDTPSWIIVNAIGKDFIMHCNGEKTIRDIIKILCKKYNEKYEESVENVLEFAHEARKNLIIDEDPFLPPERPKRKTDFLSKVWVNVTNNCNLRCIHCHLSSGQKLQNEMSTREILKLINELRDIKTKELVFSGGEPLMRDDFLDIVEHSYFQGFNRITLLTNGILIDDKIARKLSEFKVEVQVSLDGVRKETHESIRGKGTFRSTIEGIRKLVDADVSSRISMTLMKSNIDELEEMGKFIKELGVENLHFSVLQNKGRAKEHQSMIGLKGEDIVEIIKRMTEFSSTTDINIDSEKTIRFKVEKLSRKDLCGAGSTLISIAADGNVYPCSGLHDEEFLAGNIRDQSLRDIWKESETFEKFRSLSLLDIEDCRNCEFKYICGGGCHVEKYHTYGRIDVPAVRCNAEKEIYSYLLSKEIEKALTST